MKEFKDEAHNLYAIQRRIAAIENSVAKTLSILLVSSQDIMRADADTRETILHGICFCKNQVNTFSFLQSMMSKDQLLQYLFCNNWQNRNVIEYVVFYGCWLIGKILWKWWFNWLCVISIKIYDRIHWFKWIAYHSHAIGINSDKD